MQHTPNQKTLSNTKRVDAPAVHLLATTIALEFLPDSVFVMVPVRTPELLLAQPQPHDQFSIASRILVAEICQVAPSLAYHLEQTTPRM